MNDIKPQNSGPLYGLLTRLAGDRAGNTLALVAAALIPIMAMVGGGVDMGRSYLSQSRLQQACDAGVLAARKRLGTEVVETGTIPDEAGSIGQRFFNLNFQDGVHGTADRAFTMELEDNFAISGVATVNVPTTVMRAFGFTEVPVSVSCEAQLNASNTDVMMVLDVTGSMREINLDDTVPRIDVLKDTVRSFYTQVAGVTAPGTRIRYGFVPYSTNVNVGSLLLDDWVETNWKYQSRKWEETGTTQGTRTYYQNYTTVSGSQPPVIIEDIYEGTWFPPASETSSGYYGCNPPPADTLTTNYEKQSTSTEDFDGPPAGTKTTEVWRKTRDGVDYWVSLSGSTCTVKKRDYNNWIQEYEKIQEPQIITNYEWHYKQLNLNVSDWRTTSNGCIEERDTYEITDYSNVDFNKALDLDIDLVPGASQNTKWKPMYPDIIFAREKKWDESGNFKKNPKKTTQEYINPGWANYAACPAPARKLAEITSEQLDTYLATLNPNGNTYHDIGMIWGGRLLSPTGLFTAENADISASRPTGRHLIFLTDGETDPKDLSYTSYGMEPIDARRWDETSSLTLTETIEKRFAIACAEVKKRNITVWVVGFGTSLNPIMTQCAGPGHFFEADNAVELAETFATIAEQLGELRITQ